MRAAIQTGIKQIALVDVDEPGQSDDTAIVRMRASGVCGSDLHPYFGRAEAQKLPEGHEVAGEVVHLPREYDGPVKVGDLVAVDTICLGAACGECAFCREGLPFHCTNRRRGWGGGFAQSFERKTVGLFKLPRGMTAEQGALVEPLAVGVHGVRWSRMKPGATVAIVGAGTIGLMTLLAAKGLGAGDVYMVARHEHQANLADQLGATGIVRGDNESVVRQLRERTNGGVDLVFETVGGHGDTLDLCVQLARIQGTVAVLGIFPDRVPVDLLLPVIRELWMTFPICYSSMDGRYDFDVAIELIASGKAPVEKLVTHRFSLEEAPEAFRVAADKSTGSVKVHLTA